MILLVQYFCMLFTWIGGWSMGGSKITPHFFLYILCGSIFYWVSAAIIQYIFYRKQKKEEAEFQRQMLEFQLEHAKRIKEWQNQYNQIPIDSESKSDELR